MGLVDGEAVLGHEPGQVSGVDAWRAGIDRNARVSSMKPEVRVKPAVSVTASRKRRIVSGASRNHQGTPTNTDG